jgi:putative transposase
LCLLKTSIYLGSKSNFNHLVLSTIPRHLPPMLFLRVIFGVVRGYFRSKDVLVGENALLRYQVGILKRRKRRLTLKRWDRPALLWLSQRVQNWKSALHILEPETLIRWHRKGFAFLWSWKIGKKGGRPVLSREVIRLIREIARANPRWGAPRIHGELLKLGIDISPASVENYLKRATNPHDYRQTWKTFLKNHTKDVVAIDFFLVPTIWFKRLYVLVILSHDRRQILRLAVTGKPSPSGTAQQLRNTFAFRPLPRFVLHDRDRNFWGLSRFGFTDIITAHKCPWQNAYVERVIGTLRRECTDHIIALSVRQLEGVLKSYKRYYNESRTHLSLNKDSPIPRPIERVGKIMSISRVGGLHREFRRMAS